MTPDTYEQINTRLGTVEQDIRALRQEMRAGFDRLDARIDRLDAKIDRLFYTLVIGIVAAVLATFFTRLI